MFATVSLIASRRSRRKWFLLSLTLFVGRKSHPSWFQSSQVGYYDVLLWLQSRCVVRFASDLNADGTFKTLDSVAYITKGFSCATDGFVMEKWDELRNSPSHFDRCTELFSLRLHVPGLSDIIQPSSAGINQAVDCFHIDGVPKGWESVQRPWTASIFPSFQRIEPVRSLWVFLQGEGDERWSLTLQWPDWIQNGILLFLSDINEVHRSRVLCARRSSALDFVRETNHEKNARP
jgi:hypothetical protein